MPLQSSPEHRTLHPGFEATQLPSLLLQLREPQTLDSPLPAQRIRHHCRPGLPNPPNPPPPTPATCTTLHSARVCSTYVSLSLLRPCFFQFADDTRYEAHATPLLLFLSSCHPPFAAACERSVHGCPCLTPLRPLLCVHTPANLCPGPRFDCFHSAHFMPPLLSLLAAQAGTHACATPTTQAFLPFPAPCAPGKLLCPLHPSPSPPYAHQCTPPKPTNPCVPPPPPPLPPSPL